MITRKEVRQKEKELKKEDKIIYDEEGRAVVNLNVLDDSDFLSPYGEDNDVLISSETASFIENSTKSIHHRKNLTLVLNSNVIDDKEKVVFEKGIKNYYENTFLEVKRDLKNNLLITLLLTLAGLVWFGAIIGIAYKFDFDLVIEMISIAGWVFLWEAVDLFFFQRPKLKTQQLRAYALMNAKIVFKEIKKQDS